MPFLPNPHHYSKDHPSNPHTKSRSRKFRACIGCLFSSIHFVRTWSRGLFFPPRGPRFETSFFFWWFLFGSDKLCARCWRLTVRLCLISSQDFRSSLKYFVACITACQCGAGVVLVVRRQVSGLEAESPSGCICGYIAGDILGGVLLWCVVKVLVGFSVSINVMK